MNTKNGSARRPSATRRRNLLAAAVMAVLSAGSALAADVATGAMVPVAQVPRLEPGDAVVGALPMQQPIHVSVALRLRDKAGLDAFVAAAATQQMKFAMPTIMTGAQFLARHAPTQPQAQAVADYLASRGFHNVVIAPNRLLVTADGTAANARDAFMTSFEQVRTHDGRYAYANTDEVRIPASLSDKVLAVVGLQNVHRPHTFERKPGTNRSALPGAAQGSLATSPTTWHWPPEFQSIYGANNAMAATNVTAGVLITGDSPVSALLGNIFVYGPPRSLETKPAITVVVTDGGGGGSIADLNEWIMDGESLLGMSGGLGALVYYKIPSLQDNYVTDDFNTIVAANKATVIVASVGECELDAQADGAAAAQDQILEVAVAQGQTFSVPNGSTGADACGNGTNTPSWPASSQYVIAVAGTTMNATQSTWGGDTVWVESGGSASTFEPKPSWQVGFGGTGTTRVDSDVAFDADPVSGILLLTELKTPDGGGGLAAGLFAGFWADVLQKYPALGFAGPTLYALQHKTAFHDIVTGNNSGNEAGIGYAAAPGFDYASGRGSMIFDAAIAGIASDHVASQPPIADFGYGVNDLTVTFADTSTEIGGTIASHAWIFGDGTTSTAANPIHVYAGAGNYKVIETVEDSFGVPASKTHPLSLNGSLGTPKAGFGITLTGPLSVQLNDESTDAGGNIVTRNWNFGDGQTSTAISPSHTYAAAGTYPIVETVTDNLGASSHASKSGKLAGAAPVADFAVTQKTALGIQCTDHSTDSDGTIVSYAWNFGDGKTSTAANPAHTYAAAGTYDVVETVTDNHGRTGTVTEVFPTGSAEAIVNPSFETGSFSPWQFVLGKANGVTLVDNPSLASDGNYSASILFGGNDYLYQTIAVPAGKKTATLTFSVLIASGTPNYSDTLDVRILSPDGTSVANDTALATLASFSNIAQPTTYTTYSFDMTPFEGQTVVLAFHTLFRYNIGTNTQPPDPGNFYIDNVTLTVQ